MARLTQFQAVTGPKHILSGTCARGTGSPFRGYFCGVIAPPLLSPYFTIVSKFFRPPRMVVQHVIQLMATISFVPPASLISWMLIFMLIVRECMLTPSWAGVQPGRKGWVQYCWYSYGKYSINVIYRYIGMHSARISEKEYNMRIQNWSTGIKYDNLILSYWSGRDEMSLVKR